MRYQWVAFSIASAYLSQSAFRKFHLLFPDLRDGRNDANSVDNRWTKLAVKKFVQNTTTCSNCAANPGRDPEKTVSPVSRWTGSFLHGVMNEGKVTALHDDDQLTRFSPALSGDGETHNAKETAKLSQALSPFATSVVQTEQALFLQTRSPHGAFRESKAISDRVDIS